MAAPETPDEAQALRDVWNGLIARHDLDVPAILAGARAIDALLAENVQLRQLADLFRFNFSPGLIHNAPDLYRAIWGEW